MTETHRQYPLGFRVERWTYERRHKREVFRALHWNGFEMGQWKKWRKEHLEEEIRHLRFPRWSPLQALSSSYWGGRKGRWNIYWQWNGDSHRALLRPCITWGHHNISAQCQREQQADFEWSEEDLDDSSETSNPNKRNI